MATGRTDTSEVVFNSDDLTLFIEDLRRRNFSVGVDQCIAAQNLLISLAAIGQLPDDPQRLSLWLAPIFSSSPEEQEIFYQRFEQWFTDKKDDIDIPSPSGAANSPPSDNQGRFSIQKSFWVGIASFLLVLGLLFGSLFLAPRSNLPTIQNTNASPLNGGQPVDSPPSKFLPTVVYYVLGLLFLMFAALWVVNMYERRLQLKKWRTPLLNEEIQIKVGAATRPLYQRLAFRSIAQRLRRHRSALSNEIDVYPTLEMTIRNSGYLTPVYSQRKMMPEYLLLTDRFSFKDQQASLGDELFNRFKENEIMADRYYFNGNPLLCYKENPTDPPVTLNDLSVLHPDHNLIIFSDCASFASSLMKQQSRWLELLSTWSIRTLLTPKSQHEWGYVESVLRDIGFMILPANQTGIEAFAQNLSNDSTSHIQPDEQGREFPQMLNERPERWLSEIEPELADVNKLLFQLRLFLGSSGYYLLSACAVYPVLLWELTLYLGSKLIIAEECEKSLTDMVRLPWFRQGNMPDWLRFRLIITLPPDQQKNIRNALDDLLKSHLDLPGDGFSLNIVRPDNGEDNQDNVNEESESPLNDYVLLAFLTEPDLSELAVRVPYEIGKALYSQKKFVWDIAGSILQISIFVSLLCGVVLMFVIDQATTGVAFIVGELIAILWCVIILSLPKALKLRRGGINTLINDFRDNLKRRTQFPKISSEDAAKGTQNELPQSVTRFNRLLGVFLWPTKTFEDINRNPTVIAPIALSVIATMSSFVFLQWLRDANPSSGSRASEILPILGFAIIYTQITQIIIAGFLRLILRVIRAQTTFKKVLSVVAWSYCATGIVNAITLVVTQIIAVDSPRFRNLSVPFTNPAAYLPEDTTHYINALVSSFDIFTIWYLIMLSIGLAVIDESKKVTRYKTGIIVFLLYFIWVLFKIVIATL